MNEIHKVGLQTLQAKEWFPGVTSLNLAEFTSGSNFAQQD